MRNWFKKKKECVFILYIYGGVRNTDRGIRLGYEIEENIIGKLALKNFHSFGSGAEEDISVFRKKKK